MTEKSLKSDGKYISIHLRFEEDIVASSCCVYDGGCEEQLEKNMSREKGWGSKFRCKDPAIKPGLNQINGKCPLTPVEIEVVLRGIGFDNNTAFYLASGKLFEAKRHLAPLLQMFPLFYTKKFFANPEELAPFEGYSSKLVAFCLFSEVFVGTQGGNYPHFLMGHWRFLYGGQAKIIMPDKIKLVPLFQDLRIR